MIGYDPCGYAVDMLRTCYRTKARFYNGDATEEDIEWYFVPPSTPFLPVASVINSLNWVDLKERADTTHAGEVPGATRTYALGKRDVSLRAAAYCGTATDWKGNGTRPSSPVPLNASGNPACCGSPDSTFIFLSLSVNGVNANGPVVPPAFGGVTIPTSSNQAFYTIVDVTNVRFTGDLRYDLYYGKDPMGGYDNLFDFYLLDYNGYASVYAYQTIINPVGGIGPDQEMVNEAHYEQTGVNPPGVHNAAIGVVCSDGAGTVWWYLEWTGGPMVFNNPGDYVDFNLPWRSLCSYP
jgi:hypothetical protein